jgi:FKBP-type peptidyl-prolyl cis-trans isomerase
MAQSGDQDPPTGAITQAPPPPAAVQIEEIKPGDGDPIQKGCWAVVHYTGTLTDGSKFDSSRDEGRQPFELFLPGPVIEGWNQGLLGLKEGGIRKLTIPPELGYGVRGAGNVIPPNSTLQFEIECLDVQCGPDIQLPSGLSCSTSQPGDGPAADLGSWVAFHAVVTDANSQPIFDTHRNTDGRPLELMLPMPASREMPMHLGAFLQGCKAGEKRQATVPYPAGMMSYQIECVKIYNTTPIQLESGLKIEDISVGDGEMLVAGKVAVVRYAGRLLDGTVFDSNTDPGEQPFVTAIPGRVIKGWNLGLQGMRVGGKRQLTIPADLAYGQSPPPGGVIKPGDTLVFDIELLEVRRP